MNADIELGSSPRHQLYPEVPLQQAMRVLPSDNYVKLLHRLLAAASAVMTSLAFFNYGCYQRVHGEAMDSADTILRHQAAATTLLLTFAFWFSLLTWGDKKVVDSAKSPTGIIRLFLAGLPQDSLMISYRQLQGERPHQMARILPMAQTWFDKNRLHPGMNTEVEMRQAANEAQFIFVFISDDYFESAACRIEWQEIRRRHFDTYALIVNGTWDRNRTARYLPHGCTWEKLTIWEPPERGPLDEAWLLERLIDSEVMGRLLRDNTPSISESWRPTAELLAGTFRVGLLRNVSSMSVSVLGVMLALSQRALVSSCWGDGTLTRLTLFSVAAYGAMVPLVALGLTIAIRFGTAGIIPHLDYTLPEEVWLLIILVRLGVVDPLPVYMSPSLQATHDVMFKVLLRAEAITTATNDDSAAFHYVFLDEEFSQEHVFDSTPPRSWVRSTRKGINQPTAADEWVEALVDFIETTRNRAPRLGTDEFLYYTRLNSSVLFKHSSIGRKNIMAKRMFACGKPPSDEILASRMLMVALRTPYYNHSIREPSASVKLTNPTYSGSMTVGIRRYSRWTIHVTMMAVVVLAVSTIALCNLWTDIRWASLPPELRLGLAITPLAISAPYGFQMRMGLMRIPSWLL